MDVQTAICENKLKENYLLGEFANSKDLKGHLELALSFCINLANYGDKACSLGCSTATQVPCSIVPFIGNFVCGQLCKYVCKKIEEYSFENIKNPTQICSFLPAPQKWIEDPAVYCKDEQRSFVAGGFSKCSLSAQGVCETGEKSFTSVFGTYDYACVPLDAAYDYYVTEASKKQCVTMR